MPAANPVGSTQGDARLGGRYQLGQRLGRGAAAETFAAIDETSGEARAVKLFAAAAGGARAIAEFRRLQALGHPGLVKVHDVGVTDDGRLYLVMDLVAGPPLSSIALNTDEGQRR